MMEDFGVNRELAVAGLSLFVVGFAVGPLFWAPLSELYGRQLIFFFSFGAFTAFNAATTAATNIQSVLVLRFLAGSFGSSPLTNAGAVVADMFEAKERGLALCLFSVAPFMGPVLGPVAGGFLGAATSWKWIEGLMAIFSGTMWLLGALSIPETYAPVILRKRAATLSQTTGAPHRSKIDHDRGRTPLRKVLRTSLLRPWALLLCEPIVLLLSLYLAIVYGILYMLFGAYPIVYQQHRGWAPGVAGLPFLGVAVGMALAALYNACYDNARYLRAARTSGHAPPETRLPACIVGGAALPVGLFWFAWTNGRGVPWPASVAAGVPFGFGMVLVFMGAINYLVDAYSVFAASVLAGSSVLRSLFGAAFPLFTAQMYGRLGIHWASTLAAFLSLLCLPFPWLFYRYGREVRVRCKYSAQAEALAREMREHDLDSTEDDTDVERGREAVSEPDTPPTELDEHKDEDLKQGGDA